MSESVKVSVVHTPSFCVASVACSLSPPVRWQVIIIILEFEARSD